MHGIRKPIDRVFSTEGTEWHSLAEPKEEINADVLAPVFFTCVEREMTSHVDGIDYSIPNHKALWADYRFRTDLGGAAPMVNLHVCKESYRFIPNRDIWEMAQRAIEGLDCKVTCAGTLENGKYFFISISINGSEELSVKGDRFKANLNIITSHNGTMAVEAYDSLIRIVCMNTLKWSRSSKGELDFKVYHTSNSNLAIQNMGDILNQVLSGRAEFVNQMEYLMSIPCSMSRAMELAAGFLSKGSADFKLSSQMKNRVDDITLLFAKGKGNKGETLYDLLNGATEYWTSGNGTGKKASKSDKWASAEFGTASESKRAFVNFLMSGDDFLNRRALLGKELIREWHLTKK